MVWITVESGARLNPAHIESFYINECSTGKSDEDDRIIYKYNAMCGTTSARTFKIGEFSTFAAANHAIDGILSTIEERKEGENARE